ncbi:MAG: hypothetical protein D6690_04010 [Nitrospirae bacterium]|nr:MAG: hypothetical protein D6690_04010 [Nitrospirota bacterium]
MLTISIRRLPSWIGVIVAISMAIGLNRAHGYEVWLTDQSDTAEERGGYLYIYESAQLIADPAQARPSITLDLAKDINRYCQRQTGRSIRRPHMIFFTRDHRFAILSFLSGQVLFMDASSKRPIGCLAIGKNVHAAWPTPDAKMVIAANIKEKTFVRIWTDYDAKVFTVDQQRDVIDLKALETGERPDNAPICPITEASSTYAFVTLRGGGLLVFNVKATPMTLIGALPDTEIHPAGCGGVQVRETMYLNSGGGWPIAPLSYDVYAVDLTRLPETLSAQLVSSRDGMFADSHGMVAVGDYLWVVDRAGNLIEIIDTVSNLAVNVLNLVGVHSPDPAPDLIDVSPDRRYVFTNLRGLQPLTGNHPKVDNARGATPGMMVIKVLRNGKGGEVVGITRVSNMRGGKETADPHGIAVRRTDGP